MFSCWLTKPLLAHKSVACLKGFKMFNVFNVPLKLKGFDCLVTLHEGCPFWSDQQSYTL